MNTKITSISLSIILFLGINACQNKDGNKNNITNSPDDLSGKNTYVNPVDNKTYQTKGGWKEYKSDEKRTNRGNVETKQIILLTNENDIESRISVKNLADFIKEAENIIHQEFNKSDKKGELLIQFNINETGIPKVSISIKDDVDEKITTLVGKRLKKLKGYATKKDSVLFQLHTSIN